MNSKFYIRLSCCVPVLLSDVEEFDCWTPEGYCSRDLLIKYLISMADKTIINLYHNQKFIDCLY